MHKVLKLSSSSLLGRGTGEEPVEKSRGRMTVFSYVRTAAKSQAGKVAG